MGPGAAAAAGAQGPAPLHALLRGLHRPLPNTRGWVRVKREEGWAIGWVRRDRDSEVWTEAGKRAWQGAREGRGAGVVAS